MVKVIGQDEGQAYRKTCKNCGSVLEFYKKDIKTHGGYVMGDYEVTRYIKCPSCKEDVILRNKEGR